MRWADRPAWAATAGVVIGLALAGALDQAGDPITVDELPGVEAPTTTVAGSPPLDPAASAELIAAIADDLADTYVAVEEIERRGPASHGGVAVVAAVSVQTHRGRLEVTLDSIDGFWDGRSVACASGPDDEMVCREGQPVDPWQRRDRAIERWETLVEDSPDDLAWYSVAKAGKSCFELTLRLAVPAPPLGDAASYCFALGRLSTSVVRHNDGSSTEITKRAIEIDSVDGLGRVLAAGSARDVQRVVAEDLLVNPAPEG